MEVEEDSACTLLSLMVQLRYLLSQLHLTLEITLRRRAFEPILMRVTTSKLASLMAARVKRAGGSWNGQGDETDCEAEFFGEVLIQDLIVNRLSRILGKMELAVRETGSNGDSARRRLLELKYQLTQIRKDRDQIMLHLVKLGGSRAEYAGEKTKLLGALDTLEIDPPSEAQPAVGCSNESRAPQTPLKGESNDPAQLTSVERRRKVDSVMARLQRIRQQRSGPLKGTEQSSISALLAAQDKSFVLSSPMLTPQRTAWYGESIDGGLLDASPTPIRSTNVERRKEVQRLNELIEKITREANQIKTDALVVCDKKSAKLAETMEELERERAALSRLKTDMDRERESHREELHRFNEELRVRDRQILQLRSEKAALVSQYDEELELLRMNSTFRRNETECQGKELAAAKQQYEANIQALRGDLERSTYLLRCLQSQTSEILLMQEQDTESWKAEKASCVLLLKAELEALRENIRNEELANRNLEANFNQRLREQAERIVALNTELKEVQSRGTEAEVVSALKKEHSIALAKHKLEASDKLHREIGQCKLYASAQRKAFEEFKAASKDEQKHKIETLRYSFDKQRILLLHQLVCKSIQLRGSDTTVLRLQERLRKSEEEVLNLASTLELELAGKHTYVAETTRIIEELETSLTRTMLHGSQEKEKLSLQTRRAESLVLELESLKSAKRSLERRLSDKQDVVTRDSLPKAVKIQLNGEKLGRVVLTRCLKQQALKHAFMLLRYIPQTEHHLNRMQQCVVKSENSVAMLEEQLLFREKEVEHQKAEAKLERVELKGKHRVELWVLEHQLCVLRREKESVSLQLQQANNMLGRVQHNCEELTERFEEQFREKEQTMLDLKNLSTRYKAIRELQSQRDVCIKAQEHKINSLLNREAHLQAEGDRLTADALRYKMKLSKVSKELTQALADDKAKLDTKCRAERDLTLMLESCERELMSVQDIRIGNVCTKPAKKETSRDWKLQHHTNTAQTILRQEDSSAVAMHGKSLGERISEEGFARTRREPLTEIVSLGNKLIQAPPLRAQKAITRLQQGSDFSEQLLGAESEGGTVCQNAIVRALYKEKMVFVRGIVRLAALQNEESLPPTRNEE